MSRLTCNMSQIVSGGNHGSSGIQNVICSEMCQKLDCRILTAAQRTSKLISLQNLAFEASEMVPISYLSVEINAISCQSWTILTRQSLAFRYSCMFKTHGTTHRASTDILIVSGYILSHNRSSSPSCCPYVNESKHQMSLPDQPPDFGHQPVSEE